MRSIQSAQLSYLIPPSVLFRPGGLRHRPEAPQHSLHCPLLPRVYPQNHGIWFCGECYTQDGTHFNHIQPCDMKNQTTLIVLNVFLLPQNYFRDTWNIFDFITVLGSITEIIVDLQVSDH